MEATFQVNFSRFVCLAGLLFFAACTGVTDTSSQNLAAENSITPTPAPGEILVVHPTRSPLVTQTKTPPPIQTEAPTETWTAIPTIPVGTPIPSTEPCPGGSGAVTSHSLETELSPPVWEFRIYTPPCYETQADRYYPLLILIHGSTYTDSHWDDLGADETADKLIRTGQTSPFIILMPRDPFWIDPLDDPFDEALILHILPWVEQNYRTIPGRTFRAIGGISRGASWAIHLGIKHPGLFAAVGAHSLPVFVKDPPRLKRWLNEISPEEMPRFYLDIGDKDRLLDNALWFENLLTSMNIPHEWYLNKGRHDNAYWTGHLERYLRWYTSGW